MADLRIAFLGDIVGKAGRRVVEQQLPALVRDHQPSLIIANGENARSGSGLSPSILDRLLTAGVQAVTLGDHVYRDHSIVARLQDPASPVARPANLSSKAPGKRFIRLAVPGSSRPVFVITVLGRVYFPLPANDPFECVDAFLSEIPDRNAIVIVEAHTETTSEKIALAQHFRGRVAAVIGSHTHVPTADARVLPGGTAFITDVGMCGPYDSIIGRETADVLRHMTTALHSPYAVAEKDAAMCGAVIRISDSTGLSLSIERVEYRADYSKPPFVGGGD